MIGLKILLQTLLVATAVVSILSKATNNPEVSRRTFFIYKVNQMVSTYVYQCYTDQATTHSYSDVTKKCIEGINTGSYVDKFGFRTHLKMAKDIFTKKFNVLANVYQNQIVLKSGTVCRYDRGTCYDPRDGFKAWVWHVIDKQDNGIVKDKNLQQIFYGWLDNWRFRDSNVNFVVYLHPKEDKAFSFQLKKESISVNGKKFWFTNEPGYIVASENLKSAIIPSRILNEKEFKMDSKQKVSEKMFKFGDLQQYPLDFEKTIDSSYFSDADNLKLALQLYQNDLINIKENFQQLNSINVCPQCALDNRNEIVSLKQTFNSAKVDLTKVTSSVSSIKTILNEKIQNILQLQTKIDKNTVDQKNFQQDYSALKKIIEKVKNEITLFKATSVNEEKYNALDKKYKETVKNLKTMEENTNKIQENLSKIENTLSQQESKFEQKLLEFKKDSENKLEKVRKLFKDFEKQTQNNLEEAFIIHNEKLNQTAQMANENQDKIESFKNEIKQLNDQLNQCQSDLSNVKDTNKAQDDELKAIRKNLEDTKTSILGKEGQNIEKIAELDSKIGTNEKEVKEAVKKCQSYVQTELSLKNTEIYQIKADVNKAQSNVLVLKTDLEKGIETCKADLKNIGDKKEEKLEKIQKEVNEIRKKINDHIGDIGVEPESN